jgi:predicted nucleic acid-binding protein
MTRLVLDAGGLIALERNDRSLWAALKVAATKNGDVLVPSTALAQAWRGVAKQAMLARAIENCVIVSFDDVAKAVGELCGRTRTRDICDAHVALVASLRGDVLYTSDPDDLEPLVRACGRRRPTILRC